MKLRGSLLGLGRLVRSLRLGLVLLFFSFRLCIVIVIVILIDIEGDITYVV